MLFVRGRRSPTSTERGLETDRNQWALPSPPLEQSGAHIVIDYNFDWNRANLGLGILKHGVSIRMYDSDEGWEPLIAEGEALVGAAVRRWNEMERGAFAAFNHLAIRAGIPPGVGYMFWTSHSSINGKLSLIDPFKIVFPVLRSEISECISKTKSLHQSRNTIVHGKWIRITSKNKNKLLIVEEPRFETDEKHLIFESVDLVSSISPAKANLMRFDFQKISQKTNEFHTMGKRWLRLMDAARNQ